MYSIIGQVVDVSTPNQEVVGYILLNKDTRNASPVGLRTLATQISSGQVKVTNAELINGIIKGVGCNLTKLPKFSTSGVSLGNATVLIDKRVVVNGVCKGFLVFDQFGNSTPKSYDFVVKMIEQYGSANAKVRHEGGKAIISALKGEFEVVDASKLKNKKPLNEASKPAKSKAPTWRSKQYLHDAFARGIILAYDLCYNYRSIHCAFGFARVHHVLATSYYISDNNFSDFKGADTLKLGGYKSLLCFPIVMRAIQGKPIQLSNIFEKYSNDYACEAMTYTLTRVSQDANRTIRTITEKHNKYAIRANTYAKIIRDNSALSLYFDRINGSYIEDETEYYIYKHIRNEFSLRDKLDITSLAEFSEAMKVDEDVCSVYEAVKNFLDTNYRFYKDKSYALHKRLSKAKTRAKECSDFANNGLPLLDLYAKRGACDFVIEYGKTNKLYNALVKDRITLMRNLDVIFISTWLDFIKKNYNNTPGLKDLLHAVQVAIKELPSEKAKYQHVLSEQLTSLS